MASRSRIALIALVALIALAACSARTNHSATNAVGDERITVGSFDFAESELLAEVYSQAMESRGYQVHRAFNLGPREFVAPALAAGLVEFVPDYAGTALQFARLGADASSADIAETHRALAVAVNAQAITALRSAPAEDANAFVVRRETAQRYGLRRLSDVAPVASRLVIGGPPECPTRPLCLLALQKGYGLRLKEFVPLDAGGPLTRQALDTRAIDVALLFTSDPAIGNAGYVELADDRGLQPAENVTPLIRRSVVEQFGPELVERVDAVSARLSTNGLRSLNAEVAGGRATVASVAARWLQSEGLT